ncbi:glycosyltransferase family 4 protein [Aestuariibaculum sediminum]|uniref:glycosyltransferase family 4 protein n=1 Tax=Aestuariibaculum sediminum TaxID=2770637 RepID=UPI00293BFFDA|nr:glycosyltransferase [Aestuariibaculum sediminum]
MRHKLQGGHYFGYGPYVREMNLWLKHVEQVEVIAPLVSSKITDIDLPYEHDCLRFTKIPNISCINIKELLRALWFVPLIMFQIIKACKRADHIHLRCPGNIGLLGCIIQVFFPKKLKTAKYAGNWDPKAKQPLSYRFQKWILSQTVLTRNIQVLVYGIWPNQSKNIKSFFTASFSEIDKCEVRPRNYIDNLNFVFVGALVEGKRPDFAIKLVQAIHEQGLNVHLDLYGDGILKESLHDYVRNSNLVKFIKFHGYTSPSEMKQILQQADFLILASKSEGWPKAIAEAMFFGVIPVATSVSCVPYMLGYGERGILIDADINSALLTLNNCLVNLEDLKMMATLASAWSQKYTLERFEIEIKQLLYPNS